MTVGGRGWLAPGVEANGYAEGTETPPDLKESFAVGPRHADRRPGGRRRVVPAQRLAGRGARAARALVERVPRRGCGELADELLELLADALGLPTDDFFTGTGDQSDVTFNINWYPP